MSASTSYGSSRASYQASIAQGLDPVNVVEKDMVHTAAGKARGYPEGVDQLPQTVEDDSFCISGESVQHYFPHISIETAKGKFDGQLILTNYRFRFCPNNLTSPDAQTSIEFPLGIITNLKKFGNAQFTLNQHDYGIMVECKNFHNIKLFQDPTLRKRCELSDIISKVAFPCSNGGRLFAYAFKEKYSCDGWTLYNAKDEFSRLGLPNEKWMLNDENSDFKLIPTYPKLLCLPSELMSKSPKFLQKVIKYRSSGRIPTLVWIDRVTGANITRGAQPMKGLQFKSCKEDEEFFQMIRRSNVHQDQRKMRILDARPVTNAHANIGRGGGYELLYTGCELFFCDIHSIHAIRRAEEGMKKKCYPAGTVNDLKTSGWYKHIQAILNAVHKTVREIKVKRCNVVIHCSDGWDRTSQLTSLSMLLLDPYYRTIRGFAVLIEKEWLSYGHKFSIRCAHGIGVVENEKAPIFFQFIDCVYQYLCCYPNLFGFNVKLLSVMADELYACRFGTFVCNNEKMREEVGIRQETTSFWSYVLDNEALFANPNYVQYNDPILTFEPIKCRAWFEYYCQYNMNKATDAIKNQQVSLPEPPPLMSPPPPEMETAVATMSSSAV